MSGEIVLAPIGEVEPGVLLYVCEAVKEAFGRPCRAGSALPAPDYAFNPRRAQYAAEAIAQQLRLGEAVRVLGIVDLDLCVPELNFVFGLADRDGRRAVIALPRLRQSFYGARDDEALFLARAVKEAVPCRSLTPSKPSPT
jgi:archaemetzincin